MLPETHGVDVLNLCTHSNL